MEQADRRTPPADQAEAEDTAQAAQAAQATEAEGAAMTELGTEARRGS